MFFSTLVSVVEGLVPAAVTGDMLVVFALILLSLVLFATEWLPIDVTAIVVMVLLMVLEPWTQITPQEGLSGFASPATITVLAMLILSTGVNRTGIVQLIGRKMAEYAGNSQTKQLAATIGVTGPVSGFINNTPVVAILVPVVADLAHKGKTSPSKLLMPLSFASMLGGTLTVIGTSTNILASDIAAQLGRESPGLSLHAFGMFEFTKLGVIVFVVGAVYLMTVGVRLLPKRVPAGDDLLEEYALQEYLADVVVPADSSLIGQTVQEALGNDDLDIDVLQLIRYGEQFLEPLARKEIHENDTLRLRTNRETLERIMRSEGLTFVGGPRSESELHPGEEEPVMVEVVIPSGSFLVGESLASSTFRQRYDANVLAFRTRGKVVRDRFEDIDIRVGDTLLVQAPPDSLTRLVQNEDFIVAHEFDDVDYRTEKTPFAVAIIAGVVALPAFNVLPIVVSALGGVVAMILTGVLKPNELYKSVEWNVIFLLAGVIPLGVALQQTGAAALLGDAVASTATFLPAIGVLWVFYLATGLLTSVISNNASVVLMIPVAARAAQSIGANAFAFVLAVTFAASTAFMTPVGYQTNLFVYGPGGYTFSDFLRVGAPLQLLLSVVTVAGIAFFWGVGA
ncbi:SLC13 family permease [Haloferax volcanii]|uniref:Arsenite transport protein n=3 Tax=Haloferax volcanii TaxID=2246 RepID=A0A384KZ17_HALVD|nr:SLC13 family permease [Haloferax volcanii]ADE02737.1 DASS family transport protein [Haloferax volcanii DS2]ELY34512.1 arsenite transport protein [Haloferax volcanii DS2]MBS8119911.1 SLC13 family permease [Haloferax volcanii]MBS8124949.1 SLC13 family permease [Haloferax volcanii]MBS8128446.1 SLC13 family permease [Haloferax volcanii]